MLSVTVKHQHGLAAGGGNSSRQGILLAEIAGQFKQLYLIIPGVPSLDQTSGLIAAAIIAVNDFKRTLGGGFYTVQQGGMKNFKSVRLIVERYYHR
jgi:hypothetical protein